MLEDVEADAELAIYSLKKEGLAHAFIRVDNLPDFKMELDSFKPNMILSDYNLPTCTAMDAFGLVAGQIPFIILSGAIGEEKAVEALKRGVTDYVSKDSLNRLPHVVNRALIEAATKAKKNEAEKQLIDNKERLELALVGAELGTWDWDLKTNSVVCNIRTLDIFNLNERAGDTIKFRKFLIRFVRKALLRVYRL